MKSMAVFSLSVLIIILMIVQPVIAERLLGDEGQTLGIWYRVRDATFINWQDDDFLYAYQNYDGSGDYRVMIQGINIDGEFILEDPRIISPLNQTAYEDPILIADGQGGVFCLWRDLINPPRNIDVYIQHLNADLESQWGDDGILVIENIEYGVSLFHGAVPRPDGGIYMFFRIGGSMICLALDENGELVEGWPENGLVIYEGNAEKFDLAIDPNTGVWILIGVNVERRSGEYLINRMNLDGEMLFEGGIRPQIDGEILITAIIPDGAGGVFMSFHDNNETGVQHYDAQGAPSWDGDQLLIEDTRTVAIMTIIPDGQNPRFYVSREYSIDVGEVELPVTGIDLFEIGEDRARLVWDARTELIGFRGNATSLMSDNSLLLTGEWRNQPNEEENGPNYTTIEVQKVSEEGEILFDGGILPLIENVQEGGGGGIHRQNTFPAPDGGFIHVAFVYQNLCLYSVTSEGEFRWDSPFIYPIPSGFGKISSAQVMNNQSVRLIKNIAPRIYYDMLNEDASLEFGPIGRHFAGIDSSTWHDISPHISGEVAAFDWINFDQDGNIIRYLNTIDSENEVHPEQPLIVNDLLEGNVWYDLEADLIGNYFIIYHPLENDRYGNTNITKIDSDCEVLIEEPVVPFPDMEEDSRGEITPDGQGGGFIWVVNADQEIFLQRIDENSNLLFE